LTAREEEPPISWSFTCVKCKLGGGSDEGM
jgi:hypothetical protein